MTFTSKLVEPTIFARVVENATLTDDAGRPHEVRRRTVCAARDTNHRDTAWVELFDPKPTPLWRRVLGHRRMQVGAHGTMPWSALKVPKRERYVHSTEALFAHSPRTRDVKQGKGRSCSLAATVVALLQQDDAMIRRLFHDNGDGSVTVKLHPQSVTVCKTRLRSAEGALWWQLLQKAFAIQGWPHDGSHTQTCPGGYCDTFMQALTSKRAYAHRIDLESDGYVRGIVDNLSPQERQCKGKYSPVENFLAKSLETKRRHGEIVCMSTKARLPVSAWGIQPEHSYAVVDVRRRKHGEDERVDVQVYEPRGRYTRWLDLRTFVDVAIVLCFGKVR